MVFSSFIFLFLFLPVFLGIYYLTPFKFKSSVILAGSYVFYAWWRVDFLLLFAGVTLWNYLVSVQIEKRRRAKKWMIAGVVGNLLVLGIFKYFNFGVDTLSAVLGERLDVIRIVLPIGISFHAFQSISFLVDIYRRDAKPPRSFWDFAAYNSLFPQMIAGPVLRYKDLADQFTERKHSRDLFARGSYRFMLGFAKKILIADTVALLADAVFDLRDPSFADAWLGALAYTVQLYFDFSGYSDMAIGLALMMGFKFPENFDQPYISRSISEFWRRWHISLSNWLRDYLYVPLGGNRKRPARVYFNLFITMVLGGLWHGANWTFVVWGAWHGAWLAIEKAFGLRTEIDVGQKFYRIAPTFLIVIAGWVMFRSASIHQAFDFYNGMIGAQGIGISEALGWQISGMAVSAMIAGLGIIFLLPYAERRAGVKVRDTRNIYVQALIGVLFILSILKLSYQSYSPFLYFQF